MVVKDRYYHPPSTSAAVATFELVASAATLELASGLAPELVAAIPTKPRAVPTSVKRASLLLCSRREAGAAVRAGGVDGESADKFGTSADPYMANAGTPHRWAGLRMG